MAHQTPPKTKLYFASLHEQAQKAETEECFKEANRFELEKGMETPFITGCKMPPQYEANYNRGDYLVQVTFRPPLYKKNWKETIESKDSNFEFHDNLESNVENMYRKLTNETKDNINEIQDEIEHLDKRIEQIKKQIEKRFKIAEVIGDYKQTHHLLSPFNRLSKKNRCQLIQALKELSTSKSVSHKKLKKALKKINPFDVGRLLAGMNKGGNAAEMLAYFILLAIAELQFQRRKDQRSKDDDSVPVHKNDLDSMSEMGEMESLRLQMAMDRLSKMMSTLSNLLKKISETAQCITQNIK